MKRIAFVGVAAMLLACAPTMAQEAAEAPEPAPAPDATVANEATAPSAITATDSSGEAEATAVAGTPGDPMVCKRDKTERHVNVVAPGSEGRVCEVHYAKPTEGVENRVLWYATSDKGFCDQKASDLLARLSSAGFSCTNPDGTPVSIEAAAPAAEPASEVVSAPEVAPESAAIESGHPDNPEEPADAPETPAEEEPSDEGDQQE